jgi:aerobic-type carbon monoxide dehydrogenase small subunit (CoxS/CutS family)
MKNIDLRLRVNGQAKEWSIAPGDLLLDVLRREGYFGVKRGCEKGECGACTVLVNGKAINSCLMFAAQAEGSDVLTIEGLAQGDVLHPLQEAFLDLGAVQCGFCTGGMILSAKALLDRNPDPTVEEVREVMAGNYCRCTGYEKPVEAVLAAAVVARAFVPAASTVVSTFGASPHNSQAGHHSANPRSAPKSKKTDDKKRSSVLLGGQR